MRPERRGTRQLSGQPASVHRTNWTKPARLTTCRWNVQRYARMCTFVELGRWDTEAMCCFRLGLIDYSVVEPFELARRYRKKGGGAPAEEDEEREKQDEETVGQTPVVLFVLFFLRFSHIGVFLESGPIYGLLLQNSLTPREGQVTYHLDVSYWWTGDPMTRLLNSIGLHLSYFYPQDWSLQSVSDLFLSFLLSHSYRLKQKLDATLIQTIEIPNSR